MNCTPVTIRCALNKSAGESKTSSLHFWRQSVSAIWANGIFCWVSLEEGFISLPPSPQTVLPFTPIKWEFSAGPSSKHQQPPRASGERDMAITWHRSRSCPINVCKPAKSFTSKSVLRAVLAKCRGDDRGEGCAQFWGMAPAVLMHVQVTLTSLFSAVPALRCSQSWGHCQSTVQLKGGGAPILFLFLTNFKQMEFVSKVWVNVMDPKSP